MFKKTNKPVRCDSFMFQLLLERKTVYYDPTLWWGPANPHKVAFCNSKKPKNPEKPKDQLNKISSMMYSEITSLSQRLHFDLYAYKFPWNRVGLFREGEGSPSCWEFLASYSFATRAVIICVLEILQEHVLETIVDTIVFPYFLDSNECDLYRKLPRLNGYENDLVIVCSACGVKRSEAHRTTHSSSCFQKEVTRTILNCYTN